LAVSSFRQVLPDRQLLDHQVHPHLDLLGAFPLVIRLARHLVLFVARMEQVLDRR
jgi:hypothetical protein